LNGFGLRWRFRCTTASMTLSPFRLSSTGSISVTSCAWTISRSTVRRPYCLDDVIGADDHASLSDVWKASAANPSEFGSKAGIHRPVSLHELRLSFQLASSDLAHQVQIQLLALHALHQLRDRCRPQRHKTRPRGFGLEEPHQSDSALVGSALEQVCGLPPPVLRLASAPARFRRTRLMVAGGLAPPITSRTGTTSGS
jgi:hypothetical protein